MKLVKIDATSLRGTSASTTPGITIHKSGRIGFNQPAVNLLGLKPDSNVSFFEDEDDPGVRYVSVQKEGTAMRIASDKKSLMLQNVALAKKLCTGMKTGNGGQFMIAGVPTVVDKQKYYGLIPKLSSK